MVVRKRAGIGFSRRGSPLKSRSLQKTSALAHVRGIIFDLDNTLYEYPAAHEAGVRATHKIYPIKYSYEAYRKLYHAGLNENERALHGTASSHNRLLYFQRMLEHDSCFSPQIALELYATYWQAFFIAMKFEPGLQKTLIRLVRRCKLGLLTDLTADVQFAKITAHRLWPLFDALVTSEEAGIEKPSAKGLRELLRKMSLRPKDVILVGDNPLNDGRCAQKLGITFIQIERKDMARISGAKPWRKIKKISELIELLGA